MECSKEKKKGSYRYGAALVNNAGGRRGNAYHKETGCEEVAIKSGNKDEKRTATRDVEEPGEVEARGVAV